MNLAIITARGGSKRIPKKNIRDFCGRPIISYSIKAALESGIFDEVMVSTDDDEIADISRAYGAQIPFLRSKKTSGDYATTSDVINEVLSKYRDKRIQFEYGCCIYPTAPFISGNLLKMSFEKFRTSNTDVLIPVVKFSYPPQRALVENDGLLKFKHPEYERARSQDLESMFHDAGQFYFFDVNSFIRLDSLLCGRLSFVELSEMQVQDIDNEIDWELAELKYRMNYSKEEHDY